MQDSHAIFKSVNFAPHTLNQISSENASTLQCYAREIRMLITP